MTKFNSRIHKARTPIEIINLINVGGLNFSNIVEVYVHHLRRKFGRETIQSVRGMGYRLSGDV